MKHRPNISVQQKSNTKLEYLKYLAEENIQPNIAADTYVTPKGKTKSKPNLNIQKRNLSLDLDKFLKIDSEKLDLIIKVDELRAVKNKVSKEQFEKYFLI